MDATRTLRPGLLIATPAAIALCAALAAAAPARAQQADRERAQMLQMQQQLQHLQSDNAAMQKERTELQSKAQETDKLKKDAERNGKELARAHQESLQQGRELASLRAELSATKDKLATTLAELDAYRKALDERNAALKAAAEEKHRSDASQALLTARLKAQTGRVDVCESRHEGLMKFSSEVIDRYESDRLRLCEPFTGIWKVKSQTQIQEMREQLYGYRLDVPAPAQPAASASAGGPARPESASAH
jgi:chromosome segregation ATPase